jgi:hypothetical protein
LVRRQLIVCTPIIQTNQELRAEKEAVEAKTAELEEKQVELDRLKYRAKLEVRRFG